MSSKENMDSQEGYGQVAERLASQLGMPVDKILKWFFPSVGTETTVPYSNSSAPNSCPLFRFDNRRQTDRRSPRSEPKQSTQSKLQLKVKKPVSRSQSLSPTHILRKRPSSLARHEAAADAAGVESSIVLEDCTQARKRTRFPRIMIMLARNTTI